MIFNLPDYQVTSTVLLPVTHNAMSGILQLADNLVFATNSSQYRMTAVWLTVTW